MAYTIAVTWYPRDARTGLSELHLEVTWGDHVLQWLRERKMKREPVGERVAGFNEEV